MHTTSSTALPWPGLTSRQVAEAFRLNGPNSFHTSEGLSFFKQLWSSFKNPLLWVVMAAAAVSYVLGERTNAIILLLMVFLSVFLDTVNTYRSDKAMHLLTKRVSLETTVIRDGQKAQVPLSALVPQDIVVLEAGKIIPADIQILEAKDFFVDQAALTGEALPVEKHPTEPQTLRRPDDPAIVFLGTSVVTGFATGRVLATGSRTAFGRIVARVAEQAPPTDFEKGLRHLSVFLLRLTLIMVVMVFGLNLIAARPLFDAFLFSVAIAIGMTPELLPVILTVSLSRGAVAMSKKQVIVKRLPAIQNVGRMSILCTDKTGTLTENAIHVVDTLDGAGKSSPEVSRLAGWSSLYHASVPNPIDRAIVDFTKLTDDADHEKVDEFPFDFLRRRESVVLEQDGRRLLITKGAPESLFTICTSFRVDNQDQPITGEERDMIQSTFQRLSAEGFRVIAIATRDLPAGITDADQAEQHLTFHGFVTLIDPPKQGVRQTIDELEAAGVEMKVLTGDGLELTEKICRDIDCPIKGALTGDQLRQLSPADFRLAVKENTVFARIDPEQKEQIIAALQDQGEVVGFLGDGINDAPALKRADVGISVANAVDVARETADIILLSPSLEAIRDGVREGRRTFHHTHTYVKMALSSNTGNMISMTIASAFLPFLPMLPTQILLNNFLYDSSQLALSTDNVDAADVRRTSSWDFAKLRKFMLTYGTLSSVFDLLTFALLYRLGHGQAGFFQTGWFIHSVATQVFVLYILRTYRWPFIQSRPSLALFLNTVIIVGVAWVLPFTSAGAAFHFTALPFTTIASLAGVVIAYLLAVLLVQRSQARQLHATT